MLTRPERRAISRDEARDNLIPPRPHRHGEVADLVNRPRPMPHLIVTPRSGQLRINTKRNARAAYWRTVKVRVSVEMEPYFRQYLHLLGRGARVQGRTELLWEFAVDLDVHIPGAPPTAVRADPVYRSIHRDGENWLELYYVDYRDARGDLIAMPVEAAS